jgi:hypothetical protein
MTCEKMVGVKNILLTFYNCDTEERMGPISHELATDELPTVKACNVVNDRLPGGYTQRTHSDARLGMQIIRDLRVPLSWYQGCVSIDAQIEYLNGLVYTGLNGGVIGDETSNTHAVTLDITYMEIDELLPPGALVSA